jgi:hypothetical protein
MHTDRKTRNLFIASVVKIQAFFRRCLTMKGLKWRSMVKVHLMAVVDAWRIRRALNCLQREIQRFVNCEASGKKSRLRQEFHLLFGKVLERKLYLTNNVDHLLRL